MTIGEIRHGRQGTKGRNEIAETEAAFQWESPKELISPPEKKVPIKLPRVIGRSRCDGCDSSWGIVTRGGGGRLKWFRGRAFSEFNGGSSSAPLMRMVMRSPAWNRRAVGTIGMRNS